MSVEDRVAELLAANEPRLAAEEAIRGFGPRVLGYLQITLRDESAVTEAFSEFCERVWRALPAFRGECELRTWMFKLAWSAALHARGAAWRRRGRRFRTSELAQLADEVRASSASRKERRARAFEELRAALSDEDQTLLSLRLDEELSWEAIAQVLSAPPPTLRKRFERIKRRIGQLARERGLVE